MFETVTLIKKKKKTKQKTSNPKQYPNFKL